MSAEVPPLNWYDILGVSPGATPDEIRAAYRARIGQYHPDRNPSVHATAIAALINEAWGILGDPKRRRVYDADLTREEALSAAPPQPNRDQRPAGKTARPAAERSGGSPLRPPPRSPTPRSGEPTVRHPSKQARIGGRVLGVSLVVLGLWFALIGDVPGARYNGALVLSFWVCLVAGINCLRSPGQEHTIGNHVFHSTRVGYLVLAGNVGSIFALVTAVGTGAQSVSGGGFIVATNLIAAWVMYGLFGVRTGSEAPFSKRCSALLDQMVKVGIAALAAFTLISFVAEHVTMLLLIGLLALAVPLAGVAFWLAAGVWLAVLGYFVAGWLGAFIGLCTMLLLQTMREHYHLLNRTVATGASKAPR
jgi:hypothetical protein